MPGKTARKGIFLSVEFNFSFGSFSTRVLIRQNLPKPEEIGGFSPSLPCLALCDEHTAPVLERLAGGSPAVFALVLASGGSNKNWNQVESILKEARKRGLGRDGLFLAVGGGALCDMAAFAASVYMRGARLALVPTTLLAMADAALGGKTGFDLDGIRNFAGTFYPASDVVAALETLETLPEREWKSGMAEIIKAAVLEPGALAFFCSIPPEERKKPERLEQLIAAAVRLKGTIVEKDFQETGEERALLNLGHSFGHALESACGPGVLSHGEAVAWGIARSCDLGLALGITPAPRAKAILGLLAAWGYRTAAAPPVPADLSLFRQALSNDKKKRAGRLRFVVPNDESAELVGEDRAEAWLRTLYMDIA